MAAICFRRSLLLLLLVQSVFQLNRSVQADEEDDLFKGINSYRASLNLSTLVSNDNAACLAEQIAEQFKDQPCTNTTGSNTVPGTEDQLSNYPDLLAHCHLNISNTRDGAILPACVPDLTPSLVLTNFTKSQYNGYLNNTKYRGAGIGSEDNWIVVVLTSNTSAGSFETDSGVGVVCCPGLMVYLMFLVGSLILLF